ncbi:aryl-alcohol dehydrogenase-like predicted oxidoreductase [Edaphobacter aggregans]|uniref:Aryl-alcohol dehydrogenase-like predicted oxidoreductase n=1 Tax=Edaphobacter aggregans TaxID=570835 RepID=A0A3R9NZZ2_9BACT|nr:aldo/keto reductase [Edaphobacter aggregans]RSL18798.1 aryl-alcohol dehydrogenase-like predicted oxidoreductase [Edaphobacter aggregans]
MSDFLLGNDLPINRLGFGTMRLVNEGAWGEPTDREQMRNLLRRAVALGINFIDTADAYGPFIAEDIIAEALHPYPSNLVIATKGGITRQGPAKAAPCGRAPYLHQCIEMSLRRLRLERIDLYQLHRIDPETPLEESLGKLAELQQQGKIRHIGLSEVTVDQIKQASRIVPIVSVQNKYSIAERKHEAVLEYCEQHNIAFIPWYPLAANRLSGNEALTDFARDRSMTLSQLMLAWLLQKSPVMVPIPGTSSIAHLEENVAAQSLQLTAEDANALEQLDTAPAS